MRIKICGITNEADGRQAARLGADAIGLNFYPGSPRYVDPATAAAILEPLPPFVEAVGVLVNPALHQVFATLRPLARIRTIQWYGEEPSFEDPSPLRLIAAFRVRDGQDLPGITGYLKACRERGRLPAAVLLDAHVPGQYGGTGRTAPWSLLADFRPAVPVILAGGLTPANVAEAVRVVCPYAVDVASGVEYAPGRKDPELMRRFLDSAREAAAKYESSQPSAISHQQPLPGMLVSED